jgi:hypothetical protein
MSVLMMPGFNGTKTSLDKRNLIVSVYFPSLKFVTCFMDSGLVSAIIAATATVIAAVIAKQWRRDKPQLPSEIPVRESPRSKISRNSESRYEFVGLRHLLKRGVSLDEVIGDLIAIDYQTIRNIEDRDVGNLAQWRPIVETNLDCWGLVITQKKKIIGYWHFVALQRKAFERALTGC